MKAILLYEKLGENPAWSRQSKRAAEAAGKEYKIPRWLRYPAGTVMTDPNAWRLCVLPEPLARPGDDECMAKVVAWYEAPRRADRLQRLKAMAQEPVFSTLPTEVQELVVELSDKWHNELTGKPQVIDEPPQVFGFVKPETDDDE